MVKWLRGNGKRLPWYYWPIMAVWLVAVFFAGALLGVFIGWDPFISGLLAYGVAMNWEVYCVARWQRSNNG